MTSNLGHLVPLRRVGDGQLRQWEIAAAERGRTEPEAWPTYSCYLADSGEEVWVWTDATTWCPLARYDNHFTAICPRTPMVTSAETGASIADIAGTFSRWHLNAYFPLVDRSIAAAAVIAGLMTWQRRGNPTIQWAGRDESMYERALSRGTSQVARKRRRLEDGQYRIVGKQHGRFAAERMLAVDRHSWKAAYGQSMEQRGSQAALYSMLLSSGHATASFVEFNGDPIAFRLDMVVGDTVSCLKWSYDERHARVSPGQYLLTIGLDMDWGGADLRVIDLHGGPDNLKRLVQSEIEDRFDLWVGDSDAGEQLRADRLQLDDGVALTTESGRGLRHAY